MLCSPGLTSRASRLGLFVPPSLYTTDRVDDSVFVDWFGLSLFLLCLFGWCRCCHLVVPGTTEWNRLPKSFRQRRLLVCAMSSAHCSVLLPSWLCLILVSPYPEKKMCRVSLAAPLLVSHLWLQMHLLYTRTLFCVGLLFPRCSL